MRRRLRERLLLEQLNAILQTRDTARGLIVNMSDVLFDFDQATLKPGAKEKLAKVIRNSAGLSHAAMEVEGQSDSLAPTITTCSSRSGARMRSAIIWFRTASPDQLSRPLDWARPVRSLPTTRPPDASRTGAWKWS